MKIIFIPSQIYCLFPIHIPSCVPIIIHTPYSRRFPIFNVFVLVIQNGMWNREMPLMRQCVHCNSCLLARRQCTSVWNYTTTFYPRYYCDSRSQTGIFIPITPVLPRLSPRLPPLYSPHYSAPLCKTDIEPARDVKSSRPIWPPGQSLEAKFCGLGIGLIGFGISLVLIYLGFVASKNFMWYIQWKLIMAMVRNTIVSWTSSAVAKGCY